MSFDSHNQQVNLPLKKCLNTGKPIFFCDLKPYEYSNKIENKINEVSRVIKKRFQKDTDSTKNKTSENINSDEFTNAKAGYLKCDIIRAMILLFATLCCAKETSTTVFYQWYLINKRIYLNTRVLPRYVCMNTSNGSHKVVNILRNEKEMDFRASSYAPNILKRTGFYSQTGYTGTVIRITNVSRLTIYLTKLYRTILIPILFLSNDHIKILPVPNVYVFSLDIYFDSCLLIVL